MSGKTCKGESEADEEGNELVKPWRLMAKEPASPALIPVGQWLWAFPGASLPWAKWRGQFSQRGTAGHC